jgi:hypothetical protein
LSEHHRPIHFVEQEFGLQAGFVVTETNHDLKITGICPGCGASTSMTFERGTPQGSKGFLRRISPPREKEKFVTLYCQCGHVHTNRPADSPESGCGAYWPVELT